MLRCLTHAQGHLDVHGRHRSAAAWIVRQHGNELLAVVSVGDAVAADLLLHALDPAADLVRLAVALCQAIAGDGASDGAERGCGQAAVTVAHAAAEQGASDTADDAAAVHCGDLLVLAALHHIADLRLLDAVGVNRRDVDDGGNDVLCVGVQGGRGDGEQNECDCFFHGDTF